MNSYLQLLVTLLAAPFILVGVGVFLVFSVIVIGALTLLALGTSFTILVGWIALIYAGVEVRGLLGLCLVLLGIGWFVLLVLSRVETRSPFTVPAFWIRYAP